MVWPGRAKIPPNRHSILRLEPIRGRSEHMKCSVMYDRVHAVVSCERFFQDTYFDIGTAIKLVDKLAINCSEVSDSALCSGFQGKLHIE